MKPLHRVLLRNPVTALWTRVDDAVSLAVSRIRVHGRAARLFPGTDINFSESTEFKYPENITVGRGVLIGPHAILGAMARISLEDDVRISRGAVLETATLQLEQEVPYPHTARPITVERGAWIGSDAIILGGVTIGAFSVVAAGAVVTKDVPPSSVVAGVPARIVSRVGKRGEHG